MTNYNDRCSCSGECCPQKQEKNINIDFLYLDLNTCKRCQGAETNLDQAINEVSAVLKSAGYGDICGDSVDCRSWIYEGIEHPEPPKDMIVNAILKAVYGGHSESLKPKKEYMLPDNLRAFFTGTKTKKEE